MADQELVKEFPDIGSKLAAPKKISAFEKERQDAAAKREREQAETAAALKEFEDEFGAEDDDPATFTGSGGASGSYGTEYGMPPAPPRSGPGSLDPMPGAPPSQKRKRELEAMREMSMNEDDEEDERHHTSLGESRHDRRPEDASRPTVQLSSLPSNTTQDAVVELLKDQLPVSSVTLLAPDEDESDQPSISAIVTLEAGTSNAVIDNAVSGLKDKYLGLGHFLSISRHLSSAALHPSISGVTTTSAEPFGAEQPPETQGNAPPPADYRGFAPPEAYEYPNKESYSSYVDIAPEVTVRPPPDIQTTRAIHMLADRLLSEPSTERALEIEALLMSIPSVQEDEHFAFLFDARSPAGVYYRYLLWSNDDPNEAVQARQRQPQSAQQIFIDSEHDWVLPNGAITFPDLTSLADIVDDIDYASSEEESDDEDGERRFNDGRDNYESQGMERQYMTPLQRARLVHLLCRLPSSHAMLRKGDVARVTDFAISHAGTGAEDIVGILLMNVAKPFCYSLAAKYEDSDEGQDVEDEYEPGDTLPSVRDSTTPPPKDGRRDDDPSSAKLVALYVISDILSASSTAGAKNAWKYRQLFEKGLELHRTFEYLGKLDKELQWGRIKMEQWKRRVGQVFDLWESWSTFKSDILAQLKRDFMEPPLSAEEKANVEARAAQEGKRKKQAEAREKIQAMKEKLKAAELVKERAEKQSEEMGVQDVPMRDAGPPPDATPPVTHGGSDDTAMPAPPDAVVNLAPSTQKKRMRAEDMFADSDGE